MTSVNGFFEVVNTHTHAMFKKNHNGGQIITHTKRHTNSLSADGRSPEGELWARQQRPALGLWMLGNPLRPLHQHMSDRESLGLNDREKD